MSRRRARPDHPHGVLLIDKQGGQSSFDVLRDVKRALGVSRVGHSGTLDPMATGLLVVCLGEGTKLATYLTADDKRYVGEVSFGTSTNTYDAEGEVVAEDPPARLAALTREGVARALAGFVGRITQRPPAFSAIKVDGRPLYERARRGEEVEAPAREVVFYALELLSFDEERRRAVVSAWCSKGTYIRSLAHDLGAALGLHAHLSALRRVASGGLRVEDACPASALSSSTLASRLIPLERALPSWPRAWVDAAGAAALAQGQRARPLRVEEGASAGAGEGEGEGAGEGPLVCALIARDEDPDPRDGEGRLLALARLGADGALQVVRGVVYAG
ncbi:MAG: tRNA pseudouridine(55) synthase TruB [Deltaproteobacteria bacterium]|nr:tRNA pseudouridine(55) synthase TruB [Deltaproteobacteria bacterium]